MTSKRLLIAVLAVGVLFPATAVLAPLLPERTPPSGFASVNGAGGGRSWPRRRRGRPEVEGLDSSIAARAIDEVQQGLFGEVVQEVRGEEVDAAVIVGR